MRVKKVESHFFEITLRHCVRRKRRPRPFLRVRNVFAEAKTTRPVGKAAGYDYSQRCCGACDTSMKKNCSPVRGEQFLLCFDVFGC